VADSPSPQICKVIPREQSSTVNLVRRVTFNNAEIEVIRRLRSHINWAISMSSKTPAKLEIYLSYKGVWIDRRSSLLRDEFGWDGESTPRHFPPSDYIPDPVQVERAISVIRQELNVFDLAENVTKKSSIVLNLQFKDRSLFDTEIRRIRRL